MLVGCGNIQRCYTDTQENVIAARKSALRSNTAACVNNGERSWKTAIAGNVGQMMYHHHGRTSSCHGTYGHWSERQPHIVVAVGCGAENVGENNGKGGKNGNVQESVGSSVTACKCTMWKRQYQRKQQQQPTKQCGQRHC